MIHKRKLDKESKNYAESQAADVNASNLPTENRLLHQLTFSFFII